MKPTQAVLQHGQSIWYDFIERRLIWNGGLLSMIREDGLRGVTSNPSIFEKAMSGADYGPALEAAVRAGASAGEAYLSMAVEDIQWACDVFRETYEQTEGQDGYVSLEVAPQLAYDALGTIEEAHRLWAAVGRDNLMVKVPGTEPGLAAVQELLADGINVNITLLFSVERYKAVLEAYLTALERRASSGRPVDHVASVASFFVSRIDGAVDAMLAEKGASDLQGKVAIANALRAHAHYREVKASGRFKRLSDAGAMPQRLLWASTSTKNPAYPDTLYVDALVGEDTVNTVPAATYAAFVDHGTAEPRLEGDGAEVLARLPDLGVDLSEVCADLERKGVASFSDAFERLMGAVERRRKVALDGQLCTQGARLGALEASAQTWLERFDQEQAGRRIWERDGSLFSEDPDVQEQAASFMGWLDVVDDMEMELEAFEDLQDDLHDAGIETVVLMGMGGSSLAPDVFRQVLGPIDQAPELLVLDSTHPESVARIQAEVAESEACFIVASKSGTTAEPEAFHETFYHAVDDDEGAARFMAITDPGSELERLAEERGFSGVFLGEPSVGGRFSALSPFGMVPAAAMGLDVEDLLSRARLMIGSCGPELPASDNEGLVLAARLAAAIESGRDKLTLAFDERLAPFGAWLEQLVAESLGKHGKGVVVVDGETLAAPERYADDRVFVAFTLGGAPVDASLEAIAEAGHPVITIDVPELSDIVQEMFRWQFATAALGTAMGVNPFDQPNVQESKAITKELLEGAQARGGTITAEGLEVWATSGPLVLEGTEARSAASVAEGLAEVVASVDAPEYIAINAFIDMSADARASVERFRQALARRTRAATTVGFGPRFLHSTGQLHKGGPAHGLFIQLWDEPKQDIEIPERSYGFKTMVRAQELGDHQALARRGRKILRVGLGSDPLGALAQLTQELTGLREV